MAEPDPKQMQSFSETANFKQQWDDTTSFRRALNDTIIESLKVHQTVMSSLATAVASNQDMRDKLALKWLEVGPEQAASVAAMLQSALKGAQTTPPVTPERK